jgi:hypothetical protein
MGLRSRNSQGRGLRTLHTVGNLFAKLKDWRCIATRYRCTHAFFPTALLLELL